MASPNIVPYIGSKICLISDANIRYEGTLCNIDTENSTMGLINVRTFGTEGRKMGHDEIPPCDDVYDYIVFQGKEIKDLIVSEPAPPDDPAIVAVNQIPSPHQTVTGGVPQGGNGTRQFVHHMSGGGNQSNRMGGNQFMPSYMCQGAQSATHQRMMGMDAASSSTYDPNGRRLNVYVGMNNYNGSRMVPGQGQGGHRRGTSQYDMAHNSGHQIGGGPMAHRRGGYVSHRGRGGGFMGGYNGYLYNNFGSGNQRRVIGELKPQPNQILRSACESTFNFEEANMKFDKATLGVTQQENGQQQKGSSTEEKAKTDSASVSVTASNNSVVTPIKSVYDKNSSFFDNISCEVLDRQEGYDNKADRTKQRQIDVETFGQEANQTRIGSRNGNRMQRRPLTGYNHHRRQIPNYMAMMGGPMGMGGYMNGNVGQYQYVPVRY